MDGSPDKIFMLEINYKNLFVRFLRYSCARFPGESMDYAGGPAEGKVTFKADYYVGKTHQRHPAIPFTRRNVLMF